MPSLDPEEHARLELDRISAIIWNTTWEVGFLGGTSITRIVSAEAKGNSLEFEKEKKKVPDTVAAQWAFIEKANAGVISAREALEGVVKAGVFAASENFIKSSRDLSSKTYYLTYEHFAADMAIQRGLAEAPTQVNAEAKAELLRIQKFIWDNKANWDLKKGSGDFIINARRTEIISVPHHVMLQWKIIENALAAGKDFTTALLQVEMLARVAAQHYTKSVERAPFTQSYYRSFATGERGTAKLTRLPEVAPHMPSGRKTPSTPGGPLIDDIDRLVKTAKRTEEPSHDYETMHRKFNEIALTTKTSIQTIVSAIDRLSATSASGPQATGLQLIKNTFSRMMKANTLEEMTLYKTSIEDVIKQMIRNAPTENREHLVKIQEAITAYHAAQSNIRESLGAQYSRLYYSGMKKSLHIILEPVLSSTDFGSHILLTLAAGEKKYESGETARELKTYEAPFQTALSDTVVQAIQDNQATIALSGAALLASIACPALIPVIAVIELGKITAEYAAEIVPVLAGMEEAQVRMDEHAADLEEYEKARLRTGNTSDILRGLHQLDRVLESTPPEDKKAIQDKISVLLAAREEKLALYESEVKSSRDALAPIERFGASFEDPAYRDPDARYAHMLENNLLTPKDIQDWREAGRNLEKKDDLLAKFIEQIQDRRAELMRKRDFGEAELDQLRHAVDTPSARRATKT